MTKQPSYRFAGYAEPWVEKKLGETETLFTDGNYGEAYPSEKDLTTSENGVPFLRGSNLVNGVLDETNANYITHEKHEELTSGHIELDDIILAVRGSLGAIGYAKDENVGWNINSQLAIIRTNKNEAKGDFFLQFFISTKGQKELLSRNTGTALKQLPLKQLKDIPVPLPSLPEQTAIGSFFQDIDQLISLQQRKLEVLKEQKKTYLKLLFPAKGQNKPALRFAGFEDDWKEVKLGEVAEIVGGGTPSTSISAYWDGDIDWYSPAEIGTKIFVNSSQRKITQQGLTKSSAKMLPIGTILFTSRAGIGSTAILTKEGCTNQGFQSIVPKRELLDSYFAFSRSYELKRYGEVVGAGSTFVEVSGKQMAKMPILIPSLSEQEAIGSFFQDLDKTIAKQEEKVNQLKESKQTLLRKMFI